MGRCGGPGSGAGPGALCQGAGGDGPGPGLQPPHRGCGCPEHPGARS